MSTTNQNKLDVPFVAELDHLQAPDEVIAALDVKGVRDQIANVGWPEQFPYAPLSTFTMAHSATALYIDFFTRCNYLRAVNSADLSPVAQDSCVEFFVSPTSDNHYWNFEFNCIGAINASHRRERKNPTRLTADELARVQRYPSCGTRPFCELEGIFSWNLLVVIPFDLIGIDYIPGQPLTVSGNFYKCASATLAPHYLTWSPISSPKPDFHRPQDFGMINLL